MGAVFVCLVADDVSAENNVEWVDSSSELIPGEAYAKVGTNVYFLLKGDENYYYIAQLKDSNGNVMEDAISSSYAKGSLGSTSERRITVKTPASSGDYRLNVKYYATQDDRDADTNPVYTMDNKSLKAVDPIVLKATVTNSGSSSMQLNVYFTIDDERIEDSAKTITVAAGKSTDVTYEYIVKDTKQFTYSLRADGYIDDTIIKGLNENKTAYTSANDYTFITVILAAVVVALVIAMAFILRKPVVNTGKPRARR